MARFGSTAISPVGGKESPWTLCLRVCCLSSLAQRRYLRNVTPSTIEWYETAFKALQKVLGADVPPLTKSSLQQFVVSVRHRGVKPVSCNTYIKALNAFCPWLHTEGHLSGPLQLPLLKVEQRIIQTLSDPSMQALLSQKPQKVRSLAAARDRMSAAGCRRRCDAGTRGL